MIRYSYKTKLVRLGGGKEKERDKADIVLMSPDEFRKAEIPGFGQRTLKASMENIHYCKAEILGASVIGTMTVPNKNHLTGKRFSFGFYLADNCLMLIEDGKSLEKILEKMSGVNYSEESGVCGFLVLLLDYFIRDDVLFLQKYEENLAAVEEELLDHLPEDFYETVIRCRKELLALHTYYEQLVAVGEELEEAGNQIFSAAEKEAFGVFASRASRLHDHVEMLREYVLQIREMYQSQIDVRQNQIMSWLTVVTTLFLPLSILVGWYGMNFVNMPELRWKYGYIAMILVGLTTVLVEIWFFKKKKLL